MSKLISYSLIILLLSLVSSSTITEELDVESLTVVVEKAKEVCAKISDKSTYNSLEIGGTGKIDLGKFAKKLLDLGIEGEIVKKDIESQGVLQEELYEALKDQQNCRIKMIEIFTEKYYIRDADQTSRPISDDRYYQREVIRLNANLPIITGGKIVLERASYDRGELRYYYRYLDRSAPEIDGEKLLKTFNRFVGKLCMENKRAMGDGIIVTYTYADRHGIPAVSYMMEPEMCAKHLDR